MFRTSIFNRGKSVCKNVSRKTFLYTEGNAARGMREPSPRVTHLQHVRDQLPARSARFVARSAQESRRGSHLP